MTLQSRYEHVEKYGAGWHLFVAEQGSKSVIGPSVVLEHNDYIKLGQPDAIVVKIEHGMPRDLSKEE